VFNFLNYKGIANQNNIEIPFQWDIPVSMDIIKKTVTANGGEDVVKKKRNTLALL
jgi:hypothetical protein